jgi:hypothetical protein
MSCARSLSEHILTNFTQLSLRPDQRKKKAVLKGRHIDSVFFHRRTGCATPGRLPCSPLAISRTFLQAHRFETSGTRYPNKGDTVAAAKRHPHPPHKYQACSCSLIFVISASPLHAGVGFTHCDLFTT